MPTGQRDHLITSDGTNLQRGSGQLPGWAGVGILGASEGGFISVYGLGLWGLQNTFRGTRSFFPSFFFFFFLFTPKYCCKCGPLPFGRTKAVTFLTWEQDFIKDWGRAAAKLNFLTTFSE